jgi:hypothetical protein
MGELKIGVKAEGLDRTLECISGLKAEGLDRTLECISGLNVFLTPVVTSQDVIKAEIVAHVDIENIDELLQAVAEFGLELDGEEDVQETPISMGDTTAVSMVNIPIQTKKAGVSS